LYSAFNLGSVKAAVSIFRLPALRTAILTIAFLVPGGKVLAQNRPVSFGRIDWEVESIQAATVDSLSYKLTRNYSTELEKVRAIFSWIAQNISYNTFILGSSGRYAANRFVPDPIDTVSEWKSAYEMTAQRVVQRKYAVCDGYAKLFKTLCDYAGIRSELVTGYARSNLGRAGKFKTNHTWNAVMIDSNWHLLDVTWASGYVNYANEYVQRLDENYFLTDPKRFIADHYPEDLRWTLLDQPPALHEFKSTPFRAKSFVKYPISFIYPQNGWIEASIGDTVRIELQTSDAKRDSKISPDPFFDSTIFLSPASAFLEPSVSVNRIRYDYIVQDNHVEWLHLMYNEDVILRYRLNVKKKNSRAPLQRSEVETPSLKTLPYPEK
jgi:hypothetical protein